jgi:adenylate cyclase
MHLTGLGVADFFARRFDEAAAKLRGALDELPGHATIYRFLAASYAHIGKLDEARDIVEQLRALSLVAMPSRTPFRVPEHRDLLLQGLRLATDETR